MITGSSTADVGLLLVPAEKGGFEAAIAKADAKLGIDEGQTRQHARLLYLLGVEQLVVGVNKMDATMPPWSEDRFMEIKDEFCTMLHQIGYKPKKCPFIPYSGKRNAAPIVLYTQACYLVFVYTFAGFF